MLYGCGREGLMMRALAMRLHHLGLEGVHAGRHDRVPVGTGDLFLCAAGPASSPRPRPCAASRGRPALGCSWSTAEPDGVTSRLADDLLVIPAQTMASDRRRQSVLPMGSLFEGAMFLVSEVLVLRVRRCARRDGGLDAGPPHEHGVSDALRADAAR